jgi:undecaprenyl-phosphate alpha-N-acetylglucosaminyl 1-phosphatetransferase
MLLIVVFALSLLISGIVIRMGISLSHSFGIVDHPGEHKQHSASTPFVGGVGIFLALLVAPQATDHFQLSSDLRYVWLELTASIIFLTGFADDLWRLDYKVRFLVQAVVAVILALGAEVLLVDLGNLLSMQPLELGELALPFTIFSMIGVINALNMIDGIDGLSGSLSFVSLSMIAIVAFIAGSQTYLILTVILMGGVAGFLCFNLRFGTRRHALVFLGDNGSMLLGFLLSWLLISLSQGESRAMSPVTALWILAVPLMDAVGVMIRRIYFRHPTFKPDRNHLHHLLMRAGFRVQDIVHIIALIQLIFGGIGLMGHFSGVPEPIMFFGFIGIFVLYCYVIARPWRFVPKLRRLHAWLKLISADSRGIFVGNIPAHHATHFIRTLVSLLQLRYEYDLHIFEVERSHRGGRFFFATIDLFFEDDDPSPNELKRLASTLKSQFRGRGQAIRPFIKRDPRNDQRIANMPTIRDARGADRRSKYTKKLVYRARSYEGSAAIFAESLNRSDTLVINY